MSSHLSAIAAPSGAVVNFPGASSDAYLERRTWADRFNRSIAQTLGLYSFRVSSVDQDREQNTDFIATLDRGTRISGRVRKAQLLERYGDQFTIRSKVKSGRPTELDKIIEGHGDYLLYAFGDDATGELVDHKLISLKALRAHFIRRWDILNEAEVRSNPDGSAFTVFPYDAFPSDPPIIVTPHHVWS